jgi:hypothetical protein
MKEADEAKRRPSVAARVAVLAIPFLGIAAAATLWMQARAPQSALVPTYTVNIEGVQGTTVPNDGRLTILARPTEATSGDIAAKCFVFQGQRAQSVPLEPRVAPSGAIEIVATAKELFGDLHGDIELVFFIGPKRSLPNSADDAIRLSQAPTSAAAARILRTPLKRP